FIPRLTAHSLQVTPTTHAADSCTRHSSTTNPDGRTAGRRRWGALAAGPLQQLAASSSSSWVVGGQSVGRLSPTDTSHKSPSSRRRRRQQALEGAVQLRFPPSATTTVSAALL